MLFTFLLIVQTLIAFALVGVILMQRSEGGGLGVGGSSSGLMSARGQADFLTRATAVLATLFVGMSILLAAVAATRDEGAQFDDSLIGQTAPVQPEQEQVPAGPAPGEDVPVEGGAADEGVPLGQ